MAGGDTVILACGCFVATGILLFMGALNPILGIICGVGFLILWFMAFSR